MTTVKGIYENGRIELAEKVKFKTGKKVLVTFLDEENVNEEEHLRSLSLTQPADFLKEYLQNEREDLYQDYAEKIQEMKTGDIVVVEFPFTNLFQTKIRPAVVVAITPDKYKDVVVCLISSVVPGKLNKREILLKPDTVNNLRASLVIKIYRLATIQQSKIISLIGKLSAGELKTFIAAFQSLVQ